MTFANVGASDATTAELARVYFEGAETRGTTLRAVEAELAATKVQLASTMIRVNVALIAGGNAITVIRGVVDETLSAFSHAIVQLNSSFLVRFGKGVESAFRSVRQTCPVSISHQGIVPEAKVTWTEALSDDAGSSGAGGN